MHELQSPNVLQVAHGEGHDSHLPEFICIPVTGMVKFAGHANKQLD